ncbi:DUF2256 domain-containing protein [Deinococcus radiophilus]|uniref:DUF2256 domain-containing protein n=1 Tax=Deinococcus radiophilus TaxID=32062 RepID=A0A431VSC3_9DEIO|nr:DUF2256 domain-containing protein [Deinococcus radiophilus]RTR26097.1 DUF2256 domain-containing protein [Deinococcus radiophilus]UFA51575.1 DUF2256 domain-containing protein [Deinococcus radiophilus]
MPKKHVNGRAAQLPAQRREKICPVCGRPFAWRRRWAQQWDEVVYCSERCRRGRNRPSTSP